MRYKDNWQSIQYNIIIRKAYATPVDNVQEHRQQQQQQRGHLLRNSLMPLDRFSMEYNKSSISVLFFSNNNNNNNFCYHPNLSVFVCMCCACNFSTETLRVIAENLVNNNTKYIQMFRKQQTPISMTMTITNEHICSLILFCCSKRSHIYIFISMVCIHRMCHLSVVFFLSVVFADNKNRNHRTTQINT